MRIADRLSSTGSGETGRLGRSRLLVRRWLFAITSFVAGLLTGEFASGEEPAVKLVYDAHTCGPVPIPPSERGLQTVVAGPWFKVSDEGLALEGPAFERDGNLLFCDVSGRRVLRLTPDKKMSTVVTLDAFAPGGIAVHKDGRIFIAALDLPTSSGVVLAVKPDGSGMETIVPKEAGFAPNDLVFDARGGFYFTDFRGDVADPKGGVYYVSPDFKAATPVVSRLAMANGVALGPGGETLWATEFGRNLLHREELSAAATVAAIGSAVAYHFTGPAPDSMRVDGDGNVYVAMYGQGRVLVFSGGGIPIGQVLLPGRDEGHNLKSTSLAVKPGSDDLFIVTSDGRGGGGATVFHAQGFAKALTLYSHH